IVKSSPSCVGKHRLPITPTNQGSRLAQQRLDDVAPIDEYPLMTSSSFGAFHHFAVPNKLQFGLPDPHPQPFSRVTGRHRVGLLADSAEGFTAHRRDLLIILGPTRRRQRSQRAPFLFEAFATGSVTLTQKLEQKPFVLGHARKLPTPS